MQDPWVLCLVGTFKNLRTIYVAVDRREENIIMLTTFNVYKRPKNTLVKSSKYFQKFYSFGHSVWAYTTAVLFYLEEIGGREKK